MNLRKKIYIYLSKGEHFSKNSSVIYDMSFSSGVSRFSSIGAGGALATFSYFFRVLFRKAI